MRNIINDYYDKNGNQVHENDIIQIPFNKKLMYLYQKDGKTVAGTLFKYKLLGEESYSIDKEYIKKCQIVGYVDDKNHHVCLHAELYEEFKDKKSNFYSFEDIKISDQK